MKRKTVKISVIGRKREQEALQAVWDSDRAEFIAVYGRRRVGKTHLIRGFFSRKDSRKDPKAIYFEFSGMRNSPLVEQLDNFHERFCETFHPGGGLPKVIAKPRSWREALGLLTQEVERATSKVILFFDELPWIVTPKSRFVEAIDYFWNGYWSRYPNLKLIVCGSAASWMLEHLIHAKGGLHNRITRALLLRPLSLKEAEALLIAQGFSLKKSQVLEIYLVLGGIPHYLLMLNPHLSIAQNIDSLCFQEGGLLREEFHRVFASLFTRAEDHEVIIREMASKRYGISRQKLLLSRAIQKAGLRSGGTFNKRLEELEAAGFIRSFVPFGAPLRDRRFCVSDEYTMFYLRWIEGTRSLGAGSVIGSYWVQKSNSPEFRSWLGYNFEQICFKHLPQIQHALSLGSVACQAVSWSWIPKASQSRSKKEDGAQIDLLIDREDRAITLCEIKHTQRPFKIDKAYARQLLKKMEVFEEQTHSQKELFLALITTHSAVKNSWFGDLIDGEVTLEDLFK